MNSPPDDPFAPKHWRANPDGPITGDEYAYLKDMIARRMGVGNSDSEWFGSVQPPPPLPPAQQSARGWPWLRRWLPR